MAYGSSFQLTLFYAAPTSVKNLLTSVYGWQQRHERYGPAFAASLAALRASERWSNERLLEEQADRVFRFVRRAILTTPYYARRPEYRDGLAGAGVDAFPLLSKQTVRERRLELFNTWVDSPCRLFHTSGTTGQSLVFPVTAECFQREYAFRELHYSWGGASLANRDPIAFCAGHPIAHPARSGSPFWTHDRVNHHLFLSSYHLSEKNLPHYVRELETFDPVVLAGYPSSIYLLALAFRKHGRKKLRMRAVYTFSETLMDFQRQAAREAFGCPVFNWYGNTEMCANIVECEKGELHLKLEHSLVEILNAQDQPCRPGETGRLVCTGFGNTAFPLIRYEIGDVVTVSANQSSRCGRGGVLIDEVLGRQEDYIVTPDGRLVGRLDHLFKDSEHVIEAQVVQDRVDEVVLRVVRDTAYSPADERALLGEARRRLGDRIRISFDYVASIPRTSQGKFRFVLSSLNQETILRDLTG